MRSGRLRFRHPPRDRLLELGQLDDLDLSPWPSRASRRPPRVAPAPAASAFAGAPSAAPSTSVLMIRPPGPEPVSPARSTPFSFAIRRAIGEALTRPSPFSSSSPAGRRDRPLQAGWGRESQPRRPQQPPRGRGRRRREGPAGYPQHREDCPTGPSRRRRHRPRQSSPVRAPSIVSLRSITDPSDHLADRQGRPLVGHDLHQRPRRVCLEDHVRLVGLDLDQLLAELDLVADRLHPLEDRALLHRVREARHDDVLGHQISGLNSGRARLRPVGLRLTALPPSSPAPR